MNGADTTKVKRYFEKRSFAIVALALIVFVCLLIFIIYTDEDTVRVRTEAYVALLCESIVAAFIYITALYLLEFPKEVARVLEFREQVVDPITVILQDRHSQILTALRDNNQIIRPQISEINWAILFEDTDEIFLLVQGWDGWKERVATCLPAFLTRGGKIRVILHDPFEEELLRRMAERKGRTIEAEKSEIEDTLTGLKDVAKECPRQLTAYYTKRMNWYCGIYFKSVNCKHGKLLLSIYQHQPTNLIQINKVPSFLIRTDVFPGLGQWFDDEWKHLIKHDSRVAI